MGEDDMELAHGNSDYAKEYRARRDAYDNMTTQTAIITEHIDALKEKDPKVYQKLEDGFKYTWNYMHGLEERIEKLESKK